MRPSLTGKHTLFALFLLFLILALKGFFRGQLSFALPFLSVCAAVYALRFKVSELKAAFPLALLISALSLIPSGGGNVVEWKLFRGEDTILKLSDGSRVVAKGEADIGDIVGSDGKLIEKGNALLNLLPRMRFRLYERCCEKLPYPVSSVVSSVTLGVRDELPVSVKSYMVLNGTYHYLAISGLHFAVLLSLLYLLLRVFRFKRPLLKSSLFSGALLPFTGMPPSALRAFLFSLLLSLGRESGRRTDPLYITVIVAIAFSAISRFGTGAILSFIAVVGVIVALSFERGRKPLLFIFPFLFTLPFIVFRFGTFNVLSPLNSALLFPVIFPILLLSIISEITLFSVPVLNKALVLLVKLFVLINGVEFSLSKGFVVSASVPEYMVVLVYLLALLLLMFERRRETAFLFLSFLILAALSGREITGKRLDVDGRVLNSFRFLTQEGQKLSNCTVYTDYTMPFSRRILWKNTIVERRGGAPKREVHRW